MTAKKIRIEGYLFLEGNILKNPSIELGKNYLTIKESEDGHFTHKGFAIPGLINAHTHLDFHKPINERDFIKWIVKIIKEEVNPKRGYENVDKKIEGLINIGVTRIYDITRNMVTESNDPITPFFEIIGKDSTEIPEIPKNMMISLHAPYSVSQNLAKRIVERYRKKSFVMHFLETEEEQKFLTGKNNRFEEVIYPIISRKRETESFSTPSEFLIKIGYRGIRKALVHFVEVTEKDIEIVSRLKNSVIVCPRSNLFFSGKVAPIKNLMNRGINVAIGTDGLGSSPNLNLWEEMRLLFLLERIPIAEIFKMVTTNALKIVGLRNILDNGLIIFEMQPNKTPTDTLLEILFQAEDLKKKIILPPHYQL